MEWIMELVQKEDWIRWANEYWDNRILELLWYPEYHPLSKLGLYLFNHN